MTEVCGMKDKISNTFDIYQFNYGGDIKDLKEWIDKQLEGGCTEVRLNISWGYYSDIDGLELEAVKK